MLIGGLYMSLINFLLKKIVPLPKIGAYKNYLFIGPHPDDIEVGAGATVSRLVKDGKNVSFLICTDGCYGTEEAVYDKSELVRVRQKESLASANSLGVTDVTFLPYGDGWGYDQKELTVAIAKEIIRIKPDVIFCPDPNLATECHPDHLNVGRASANAFMMCANAGMAKDFADLTPADPKAIAFYYTDRPNVYFKTKPSDVKAQLNALKLFPSQFTFTEKKDGSGDGVAMYLQFRSIRFGLKTLKGRADGFRAYTPTHTHCCSEYI